jgi:hypothetical protein
MYSLTQKNKGNEQYREKRDSQKTVDLAGSRTLRGGVAGEIDKSDFPAQEVGCQEEKLLK